MRIVSVGLDATDIPRVREAIQRYGNRFLRRVFTDAEIAYCAAKRDPVPSFAARFAAKEAAMKALGTGHSRGVLWRDLEVIRVSGPPQLQFHRMAAVRLAEIGGNRALISLTHADTLALAEVLILSD